LRTIVTVEVAPQASVAARRRLTLPRGDTYNSPGLLFRGCLASGRDPYPVPVIGIELQPW